MGAPVRQSMHACVPPYPVRVGPGIPHDAVPGSFIAPVHVPCDVTNDVIA